MTEDSATESMNAAIWSTAAVAELVDERVQDALWLRKILAKDGPVVFVRYRAVQRVCAQAMAWYALNGEQKKAQIWLEYWKAFNRHRTLPWWRRWAAKTPVRPDRKVWGRSAEDSAATEGRAWLGAAQLLLMSLPDSEWNVMVDEQTWRMLSEWSRRYYEELGI